MFSCSLLPRYKSRKSYHQERSCRTAPKMDKLHNINIDNMQGKLHCIVMVKHDLLTTNAYKLALTLQQKNKMHNISDVLHIMNKMYCHYYYTFLMTKILSQDSCQMKPSLLLLTHFTWSQDLDPNKMSRP